jgi:hypothetical protein
MRQPQTKFRNETLAIQNVATLAPGARDLSRGVERMTMDGTDITNPEGRIPLTNDGVAHTIRIQMGPGQSGSPGQAGRA